MPQLKTSTLEKILPELQKSDGVRWLRILGQPHFQYQEIPFWVLVRDREQIRDAIPYLQEKLRPLQQEPEADVTVAFTSYENDKEYSYGMFKGEEFFERDAFDNLYDEPYEHEREISVFDDAYPDDEWALKRK